MLRVDSVTKRYGNLEALSDISLEVERGSVTAVLGANGAGKTTLVKCVLGLVRFAGRIAIDGIDVAAQGKRARALMGYLPQGSALHLDLTVTETAKFYADMKGVDSARAMEAVEQAGLGSHAAERVASLSGGMSQRLSLALAQLGEPPLLILDEPAAGLDIHARLELRELIRGWREGGRSVLLSTHWVEDVPFVADQVIALDRGCAVYQGPAGKLGGTRGPESRLFLRINGEKADAAEIIRARALGDPVDQTSDWLVVRCRASQKVAVVEALAAGGIPVLDLRVEEAPVSEAIFSLGADRGAEE